MLGITTKTPDRKCTVIFSISFSPTWADTNHKIWFYFRIRLRITNELFFFSQFHLSSTLAILLKYWIRDAEKINKVNFWFHMWLNAQSDILFLNIIYWELSSKALTFIKPSNLISKGHPEVSVESKGRYICEIVNSLSSEHFCISFVWLWSQREVSKTNGCKIAH